jgi:hypothetical protein
VCVLAHISLLAVLIAPPVRCVKTAFVTADSDLTLGLDRGNVFPLKGSVGALVGNFGPAVKWLGLV